MLADLAITNTRFDWLNDYEIISSGIYYIKEKEIDKDKCYVNVKTMLIYTEAEIMLPKFIEGKKKQTQHR